MSTAKTRVDERVIDEFLASRGISRASVELIADGELSQALFFDSGSGQKVLRLNSRSKEGFIKDKFAAEHFAGKDISIPRVEEIGELPGGIYFAISERSAGQNLDKIDKTRLTALMPRILDVADRIHSTPMAGEGFGWWDATGKGEFKSWHEALVEMQKAKDDYKLAEVSFYEKELHDRLAEEIADYMRYCPEKRSLVHGDYGFGNVISDGREITGVIDWHGSMYGDPVFDIAWLDFWDGAQGYVEMFRERCVVRGSLPEKLDQRLTCYKLIIGVGSLCFFAKSAQPEKYDFAKKAIGAIRR